jgi:hypothetical protein
MPAEPGRVRRALTQIIRDDNRRGGTTALFARN